MQAELPELNEVMDLLSDAIILLDEQWRICYANLSARKLSRLAPENINRETLWELFPQLAGSDLEQAYRDAQANRIERRVDRFYYEPFLTWFTICIRPTRHGLLVQYQDITSLREAEDARSESELYLRLLLDSTPSAFYAIDENSKTTLCNRAFLEMLGFDSLEQVRGLKLHSVIHHTRKDGTHYDEQDCPIYRAAMIGEPAHIQDEVFFRKDGTHFPVEYWAYPIVHHGTLRGAITTFVDVTDRKRTESALIQSEKLAAVGRLASSIAHEINNPLEAVTNLIYLARSSVNSQEIQEYLQQVDEELRRISMIASQTLRFHKQSSKPQAIRCQDLFSAVLSLYEGRFKNLEIRVNKRKRANQPVEVYEGDIRQVLNNLIGNAVDAMARGGELHLRSAESHDWKTGRQGLTLTIADTGEGMSRETLGHIFEAFFTTKGIGGTGLGLWVSADIVNRHNGRIRVRSRQSASQHGTVFRLFLPFATQPQAQGGDRVRPLPLEAGA